MTSAEMLAVLKTRLDEGGFRSDDELYQALSNGQKEVLNYLVSRKIFTKDYAEFKSKTLASGEAITESRPVLSAVYAYGGEKFFNANIMPSTAGIHAQTSVFHEPDQYTPVLYQENSDVTLKPTPKDGSKIEYVVLKEIPDIDASTEPTLDERTHNAIVQWAFAEVVEKDDAKAQEAMAAKKVFYEMLSALRSEV